MSENDDLIETLRGIERVLQIHSERFVPLERGVDLSALQSDLDSISTHVNGRITLFRERLEALEEKVGASMGLIAHNTAKQVEATLQGGLDAASLKRAHSEIAHFGARLARMEAPASIPPHLQDQLDRWASEEITAPEMAEATIEGIHVGDRAYTATTTTMLRQMAAENDRLRVELRTARLQVSNLTEGALQRAQRSAGPFVVDAFDMGDRGSLSGWIRLSCFPPEVMDGIVLGSTVMVSVTDPK